MGKLERVAEPGGIAYDWPETTRYDSLEVEIIKASAQRANEINVQKGYDKNALERAYETQKQADKMMNEEQMPIPCYVIKNMSYCHLAMYSCMKCQHQKHGPLHGQKAMNEVITMQTHWPLCGQ